MVQKAEQIEGDSNLPTVRSMDELRGALTRFTPEKFNILVPRAINFSSALHKVALEVVFINNSVDSKNNGPDIYSTDGGRTYTLHYKAVNRIAGSAGITWTKSEVVKRETDKDGRATYVEHVVGWKVKRPNGTLKEGHTVGFYKFEEDKSRFTGKQPESRRHFAEQLAESNAKLRGIYEALEQLPRQMSREEYGKPFIVPCVVEDLTSLIANDPIAKQMVIAHALGMGEQLFGQQQKARPQQISEHQEEPRSINESINENRDGLIQDVVPEPVLFDGEKVVAAKINWLDKTPEERLRSIAGLIAQKKYVPKQNSMKPEDLTPQQQARYINVLTQLEAPKEIESSLPREN